MNWYAKTETWLKKRSTLEILQHVGFSNLEIDEPCLALWMVALSFPYQLEGGAHVHRLP